MQQNTEEWLQFRRTKVGASDAPIILGISPWKTPHQLWSEKVFGSSQQQTSAMARGHALEDAARKEFERLTGIDVMPRVMTHPVLEWQMASFDGVSFDGSTFVEIKCPNRETHQKAVGGEIPDHYMAQVQHQMSVLNSSHGYYFSFDGSKGAVILIQRDEEFIEKLIIKEQQFFDLMTRKEPPALMPKDYTVRNGGQWAVLAAEWNKLSGQIKDLQEKEQEIRNKLIELGEGKSSIGEGIRMTKSICRGAVDYKQIPELFGVDLESYRKASFEKWALTSCK